MSNHRQTPKKAAKSNTVSYRQSLRKAFECLSSNFTTFLKAVWPSCLIIGGLIAILLFLFRILPFHKAFSFIWLIGLLVIGVHSFLFQKIYPTYQKAKTMKQETSDNAGGEKFFEAGEISFKPQNFSFLLKASAQTLIVWVIEFSVYMILFYGFTFLSSISMLVWILYAIIVLMLAIPFNVALYNTTICSLGGNSSVYSAWNSIVWGFKQFIQDFGSFFVLLFVSFSIFLFLSIIFLLPLLILNMVVNLSDFAVINGDSTDLPQYITIIYLILGFVLSAWIAFLTTIPTLPMQIYIAAKRAIV